MLVMNDHRPLPLELFELAARLANPFQAQAVDQIQGPRCPFVLLMLLVRPEDELRNGGGVTSTVGPNIPSLARKAVEEFLADHAGRSGQPPPRLLQLMKYPEGIILVRPAVAEGRDQFSVCVDGFVSQLAET